MYINSEQKKLNFYARMAGLSYLVFVISGFIMTSVLNRKFVKFDDITLNTVFQNEFHFRLSVLAGIIIFLAVISASVFFYRVCRSINTPLSQIALCCRLVEAIVGSVAVLLSLSMIALVSSSLSPQVLDIEQLRKLVLILAHFDLPTYEYSWIFMGFAGSITFYLFYKVRYIPRALSVWGIITYLTLSYTLLQKYLLLICQKK